ncbi:pyrroline-5-carboxylate reductase [Altererythrobacter sp. KTW20L]|uniref:pyrroline-5-carboxylate reductase family protein n=1 Tax=Altererythrobacter sp. KTW20L TaxID=2942210 RepID=UPI0020C1307B|nr:pyrroline-5-carboxylate reductase [Altererythrobacter sp. KTW20L]MCL6252144.1 pyrroline-5-carboxylate reductase [Altererythrobacter sp. KTW20L]
MINSILIVGCGNMAGAMVEGWLAAGHDPAQFTVVDPLRDSAPGGIAVLREIPAAGAFDAIVLGVKPQNLGEVAPLLAPLAGTGTLILSLLAGIELEVLRHNFPNASAQVRVMPNLAVSLGKAPIALVALGLDEAGRADVTALMEPLGTPGWIGEDRFDLVTALAGSGPAFVYRFIDALGAAATRLGLPEDQARALALAMVEGAAALAAQSPHDPGQLAEMVASKGGVTRAGLDVLDADGALNRLVTDTLRAARDRSAEMAREARGKS